jgi:hypothetical protein
MSTVTEELRQNVFSSIHMSTLAKAVQANITYPSCTFCGGTLVSGSSKGSPKRKSALCQLSLYTNSSESFVVWYKKLEEPKGLLWMRSCCIRKGVNENTVELISRGCRGRCSYTLKFSSLHASDEWYKLLKQESRKIPSLGDELPSSLDADEGYFASLDSMLTDTAPLNVLNEVLHGNQQDSENQEESRTECNDHTLSSSPKSSPKSTPKSKNSKSKTIKGTKKSSPVICNPLQGLSSKSRKSSVIPISSSFTNGGMVIDSNPLESIENSEDYLSRWSWPMKA